ncbi:hypothetical protein K4V17_12285 [Staphylococcus epidermidis]|nr:hypothetical protein [Staphylococcus epidermidis]
MASRIDADNYVLNQGFSEVNFIREAGGEFYYEFKDFWDGRHTIKVREGFLVGLMKKV